MKCSQTISIEQKYGKYLFDNKIKTKQILTKQVTIKTNEDISINEKDFKSKIKEDIDEKQKFIQIIQSFEDPLSPDNITLENLSFISDIKTPDSQFTIQLKEELPKVSHESIKSDFLYDSFLNPDNLKSDIIDFKKNYFIEPLLNRDKYNDFKKSIKIIKNDILENINNSIDDIDNKDNKEEKIEKENENDEFIKKKYIIIKSLIYFNKDGIIAGIENFKKRVPDLNKSKFEENNKFEKNIYLRIEDRIREILNKCKCDKLSQLREFENNYIQRIIIFQNKSSNYKFICIKGIIIGLLNIINDYIGKEYLKLLEEKNDSENGEFILEIIEKYEIMKKICIYLEKDFILFIKEFKQENKLEFELVDVFSDMFWDFVFRIKEINIYFTNNYNSEKISKTVNEAIDKIINLLLNINVPYKKLLGEILNISCIKQENIYLMNYIIKYKKPLNKNEDINNNDNITLKEKELHNSSSCDKILNNIINNIENKDEINEANNRNIENNQKFLNNDENNKSLNIAREEINNNDNNNENNNINNNINININDNIDNINDKKNDLSLGKSLSMDICNNKLSDKDSLEKVYNYILYGENENDKKKQRKKHKKRKKNKNNSLIIDDEKVEQLIDPVVEEYKNYMNNFNNNCPQYIKKIKPNLKEEWINNISNYIKE